ncbi:MAG TPA: hypothetical protein DIT64_05945 [Verrucomicrobiales bacterium]|nr:hypothetical protein [Verrucomicrobiales bacterium]HCN76578.1 hypothetical protein [Verrucomicrobiales bacterium]HRK13205.1 hypothetical protein [Prosthecobacter sp.]
MHALKRNARLLYLLALCQVLGGPLVIGGLLVLERLTRGSGLEARMAGALARMEAAECAALLSRAGLPAGEEAPASAPAKKSKCKADKNWSLGGLNAPRFFPPAPIQAEMGSPHDPPPARLAQAPPLPPPRVG